MCQALAGVPEVTETLPCPTGTWFRHSWVSPSFPSLGEWSWDSFWQHISLIYSHQRFIEHLLHAWHCTMYIKDYFFLGEDGGLKSVWIWNQAPWTSVSLWQCGRDPFYLTSLSFHLFICKAQHTVILCAALPTTWHSEFPLSPSARRMLDLEWGSLIQYAGRPMLTLSSAPVNFTWWQVCRSSKFQVLGQGKN